MGEDRRGVALHLARIGTEFARGGDREHLESRTAAERAAHSSVRCTARPSAAARASSATTIGGEDA